mgnify:CR=1 FL=1
MNINKDEETVELWKPQIDKRVKLEYENIDFIGIDLIQNLSETYGSNIQYDLTNNPSITISIKGDIINSLRGTLEKIDEFNFKKVNKSPVGKLEEEVK